MNAGTVEKIEHDLGAWLGERGFTALPLSVSGVGHFHLAGHLNGVPVEVLVDTGAASTVVDMDFARGLHIALVPMEHKGGGAGSATLDLYRMQNAQLHLGDMNLTASGLVAIDFSNIRRALASKGVKAPQVVLGADFLRRHAAIIDYATARLYARQPV